MRDRLLGLSHRLLGNNLHCHPDPSLHLGRVDHLRVRGDLPLVALGEDPRWAQWVQAQVPRRHP